MEFAYAVAADKQAALKKVLEEEPYAKDSFASLGYVLKESASVGLKGGRYVVYFKSEDSQLVARLKERLGKVEGVVEELAGSDKQAVIDAIIVEQESAASGFGSIFG